MAKRELLRKIDQDQGPWGGGGSYVAGMLSHRMLSATHNDSDAGDTPVRGDFMIFDALWEAMSFSDIIEMLGGLFIGRYEGAHVGLFAYPSDEGLAIEFQVTDTGGAPLASIGSVLDVPNTFWAKVGHQGGFQLTYVNDGTRDGIEKAGVLSFPADAITGYLGIEYGGYLPDAYDRDPGDLFALESPGDPYSFILYLRDNLDSWQRLIGAGYAALHSHTSEETGGDLSLVPWDWWSFAEQAAAPAAPLPEEYRLYFKDGGALYSIDGYGVEEEIARVGYLPSAAFTVIDAKGDLIVGSADDTAARLAVGWDGYLLAARSTATDGIDWEGQFFTVNYVIDGGGAEITDGVKPAIRFPCACSIVSVALAADQSGSIVVDLWKDTQANYPPTNADSITAAAPPTLASADHGEDTVLTGWTKTVAAGDWLTPNVDSCTTITWCTLAIRCLRT